jgi:fatty acid desaturase
MANAMRSLLPASIPIRTNLVLAGFFVAAHVCALIVLPLAGTRPIFRVIALSALVLGTPAHWALVHDAIHGQLLPTRAANNWLGRVLAIFFGVPFRAVRLAHLRHHRYNRSPWGREEIYDPKTQSRAAAYFFHYVRISVGLYLGELAIAFLCWLPPSVLRPRLRALCPDLADGTRGMAHVVDQELLTAAAIWQIRRDATLVIALYAGSLFLYRQDWPLLVGCLLGRALVISQLDHAPHHATPLSERDYALNMRAPRWIQFLLLGFNMHRTHHEHPNLPWSSLLRSSDFRADDISFVRAVVRQWRGPIDLQRASRTV